MELERDKDGENERQKERDRETELQRDRETETYHPFTTKPQWCPSVRASPRAKSSQVSFRGEHGNLGYARSGAALNRNRVVNAKLRLRGGWL